jgi:hypothetical protein
VTDAWFKIPTPEKFRALARNFSGQANEQFLLDCASRVSGWYGAMWDGGNQWAWCSWISFLRHVVKLDLDYSKYHYYEQAYLHGGPRVMHPEFCMVSDRPEVLTVDDQNRPHNDTGPFCRWRDGSALYAVHGVRVPWWVVEKPERLAPERVLSEPNAEVRRVMIDRYPGGIAKLLLDAQAKEIHRDDFGTLYRLELRDDEPIVMVKVVNSTPEADGSSKDYFLRVPPTITTAHEAVAWTFEKTASTYAPLVET